MTDSKVECICNYHIGSLTVGKKYTIVDIKVGLLRVIDDTHSKGWYSSSLFKSEKPNPRPHADLICKWAKDDRVVAQISLNGRWITQDKPHWNPNLRYRLNSTRRQELIKEIEKLQEELKENFGE